MVFGLLPTLCSCLLPTVACMSKMRLRRVVPCKKTGARAPLIPLAIDPQGPWALWRSPGHPEKKMPQRPRIANDAQIVVKQLPVDEKASKTLEISGVRTALSRRSRVYAYRPGPSMPSALAIGYRDKWT